MSSTPFRFDIPASGRVPTCYDNHIVRRLSAMAGQFSDEDAYAAACREEDVVLYEVYEIQLPEAAGELRHGVSILHPGKIGDEFYMTKGHFHTVLETGEVYYCLQGEGVLVMETPEGDWAVEELRAGGVVYVPPRWAHRSVNTSFDQDLTTFFVYPSNAGHDYRSIEEQGFRKLVVECDAEVRIVDNPRWQPPEQRP